MTETDKQDVTLSPKARELLTELADFLDRLPEERFDYTRWVGRDWRGSPDLSCGTTACAIGWATTLPSWRAAGLALQPSRLSGGLAVPVHQPTGRTGLKGIAAILGIPVDNAEFLFLPDSYLEDRVSPDPDTDAAAVADHIRSYLEWVQ